MPNTIEQPNTSLYYSPSSQQARLAQAPTSESATYARTVRTESLTTSSSAPAPSAENHVVIVKLRGAQRIILPTEAQSGAPFSNPENKQLQNALQKPSINAEIEIKPNGGIIFRFVDDQAQKVELQIPSEVAVALVSSYTTETPRGKHTAIQGALIDQRA